MLAVGHVAIEHCVAMHGVVACHAHIDGCQEGEPEGEGDGHHHHHQHFTALASWSVAKALDLKVPVLWVSFDCGLTERLLEIMRVSAEPHAMLASWESPPDERAAGWLLTVRTALPVRGPSLAA